MRRWIIAAVLPLAACGNTDKPGVPGSGSGPARSYPIADFDQVELTGSDNVEISTGTGFSVRAEGDPATLDRLRITKDGARLRIGRTSGMNLRGDAKVFVTLPRLSGVGATGSGNMVIDHVDGDRFSAATTGSGDLTVRALKVGEASLSVTGSGGMTVAGEARMLSVSLAGSGDIDAQHLSAGQADVNVMGSGSVRAGVKGAAKVNMMGSGDVDLGDAARCTISKMGSGSVKCGG